MGFSLSQFVAGAAETGQAIGLKNIEADIVAERDRRMQEYQQQNMHLASGLAEGREVRAEERRRAPYKAAEADVDKFRKSPIDDASGTVRTPGEAEVRAEEARIYRRHGLINEALNIEGQNMQRDRDTRADLARTRDDNRADTQLAEQIRHNRAMESNAAATNARMMELTKVQVDAARLDLNNKQELQDLQKKFDAETDPAKRATIERSILTRLGKAKELPEPVKAYVDTVKAELSTYAKVEAEGGQLPDAAVKRRGELQAQMQQLITTGTITGAGSVARPKVNDPFAAAKPKPKPAAPSSSDAGDVATGRAQPATGPGARSSGSTPSQFGVLNEGMQQWDSMRRPGA